MPEIEGRVIYCAGPGRLRLLLCRIGWHKTGAQFNPYFARCESCGKITREW